MFGTKHLAWREHKWVGTVENNPIGPECPVGLDISLYDSQRV